MTSPLAKFGNYALGDAIADHPEAEDVTQDERILTVLTSRFQDALKIWKKTNNFKIYRSRKNIEFLGCWWVLKIGVYEERIYKLSMNWYAGVAAPMVALHLAAIEHCRAHLGPETSGSKEAELTWNTDFGAVILKANISVTSDMHGKTFPEYVVSQSYSIHLESTSNHKPID